MERGFSTSRSKFDIEFPFFRRPREIGVFSQDGTRQYVAGRQQMQFYVSPINPNDVCFDLRVGYKDFIRKDETKPELLNGLLRWILRNPSVFTLKADNTDAENYQSQRDINTDFVCWRGLLTRLLCTPFETSEGWKIAVTRFQNTYFLCEFDTEKKIEFKKNRSEKQDEMCYWGWKFEQYVTADKVNGAPDTRRPVNTNEGFCSIVRSRLNKHSLVYGGEIDAALPDKLTEPDQYKYVEFKTTMEIETQKQDFNFRRYKLIKWWAQSFLIGIENIVAGFRDREGVVHRLETFDTLNIPNMVKHLRDPWKPNICFNFLDQILTFIKETIVCDDPSIVHLLEWEPGSIVICHRLEPNSSYTFLPQWYTTEVSSNTQSNQACGT